MVAAFEPALPVLRRAYHLHASARCQHHQPWSRPLGHGRRTLLIGGSSRLYTIGFGILCVAAEAILTNAAYAGVLKWLTLSLFAYVAVVFAVHVPWSRAVAATVLPT